MTDETVERVREALGRAREMGAAREEEVYSEAEKAGYNVPLLTLYQRERLAIELASLLLREDADGTTRRKV